MSFLRRLRGGPAPTGMKLNVNYFKRIRDDASLEVVGEAYRQELVATARPPGPGDLPEGMPPPPAGYYKAALIPEPGNQYDRNAIRVTLWAGGSWSLVGYLSREDAVTYQPLFGWLAEGASGTTPAICCDAALKSEQGGTGVVLHIGTPGECISELATDDVSPLPHEWVGKFIAFTGERATVIHGVPLDRAAQFMLARWAGCEVVPRLTKKTDLLVVADQNVPTSNLQKAKEYGVPIVAEPDFLVAVGIPSDAVGRNSGRWAKT